MCICVDDVGLHHGINEAACELIDIGRVQAVSCMVGGSAWLDGADHLRQHAPQDVDVGLHLDLTEAPLIDSTPRNLVMLIAVCALHRVDRAAIRREIDAQLDAFEDALGRAPSHVDGHQHVHQLPGVRDELLEALIRRYRAPLPWLRSTRRPASRGVATPKAWLIERLGARALASLAAGRGCEQNAHLLGIHDFRSSEAQYGQLVRAWLDTADDADLLLCHASVCEIADDRPGSSRRHEYEVLRSRWLGEYLQQQGIALMPMTRRLAQRKAAIAPAPGGPCSAGSTTASTRWRA